MRRTSQRAALNGLSTLLAASALIAACSSPQTSGDPKGNAPSAGNKAPTFQLPDLNGKTVSLEAFKNKAVILDFWASWCAPCKDAMPFYDQLGKEHGDKLVVIGVNVDTTEKAMKDALARTPVQFMILHDASGKVAEEYKVEAMPSTYFINGAGEIVRTHKGFLPSDRDELRKAVASLVSGQ